MACPDITRGVLWEMYTGRPDSVGIIALWFTTGLMVTAAFMSLMSFNSISAMACPDTTRGVLWEMYTGRPDSVGIIALCPFISMIFMNS